MPACLPAFLPPCLPSCLPARPPACLPTCLPACLPAAQELLSGPWSEFCMSRGTQRAIGSAMIMTPFGTAWMGTWVLWYCMDRKMGVMAVESLGK